MELMSPARGRLPATEEVVVPGVEDTALSAMDVAAGAGATQRDAERVPEEVGQRC